MFVKQKLTGARMLRIYFLVVLVFYYYQSKAQTIADQSVRIKSISERWELADSTRKGTFLLTSYKPFYFSLGPLVEQSQPAAV